MLEIGHCPGRVVAAAKPEALAAPEENTAGVGPQAGCSLAWVPKGEFVGIKPPKLTVWCCPRLASLE